MKVQNRGLISQRDKEEIGDAKSIYIDLKSFLLGWCNFHFLGEICHFDSQSDRP